VVQKRNVIGFNMPSKIQVLLASGRPIIASVPTNGTAARAIHQSAGGLVVEPERPTLLAAAVEDLYLNPAKANRLAQQGRAYALQNYSFEKALSRYEDLFYEVTATRVHSQTHPNVKGNLGMHGRTDVISIPVQASDAVG